MIVSGLRCRATSSSRKRRRADRRRPGYDGGACAAGALVSTPNQSERGGLFREKAVAAIDSVERFDEAIAVVSSRSVLALAIIGGLLFLRRDLGDLRAHSRRSSRAVA